MPFDFDQFVADCRVALAGDRPHSCVREVVARAVSNPASILKVLGEPKAGAFQPLYRADDLTIMNIIWAPYLMRPPHNARTTSSGVVFPALASWKPPAQRPSANGMPSFSGATSFIP